MDFFDSKRILFDTWDSWLSYTKNAVTWLLKAIFGVTFAIVVGIVSLLYKFALFMIRKIRQWPLFSFITLAIILSWCMVLMFVKLSYVAKTYEHQRDSIGYELTVLKETIVGDTIHKENDSIRFDSK